MSQHVDSIFFHAGAGAAGDSQHPSAAYVYKTVLTALTHNRMEWYWFHADNYLLFDRVIYANNIISYATYA